MANYNLVANTSFNPLTYKELMEPFLEYKKDYEAKEEALAALEAQAATLDFKITDNNPLARAMYDNYMRSLRANSDLLSSSGITPTLRDALKRARVGYGKIITPIEDSITRLKELTEERRKAQDADASLWYEKDDSELNVDDLLANPNSNYGRSFSGNKITAEVMALAENLQNSFRYGKAGDMEQVAPYQFRGINQRGYTEAEITAYLNGTMKSDALDQILKQVADKYGINTWKNDEAKAAFMKAAASGLYKAVGKQEGYSVTDSYGQSVALKGIDELYRIAAEDRAANRIAAAGDEQKEKQTKKADREVQEVEDSVLDFSYDYTGIPQEQLGPISKYHRYKKFFKRKGQSYELNSKGKEELLKKEVPNVSTTGQVIGYSHNEFKDFLTELVGGKEKLEKFITGRQGTISANTIQGGNLGNIFAKWEKDNLNFNDTKIAAQYGKTVDAATLSSILDVLSNDGTVTSSVLNNDLIYEDDEELNTDDYKNKAGRLVWGKDHIGIMIDGKTFNISNIDRVAAQLVSENYAIALALDDLIRTAETEGSEWIPWKGGRITKDAAMGAKRNYLQEASKAVNTIIRKYKSSATDLET